MTQGVFRRNLTWAAARAREDRDFFPGLAAQEAADYLWIGCADSHLPAHDLTGLAPGELFVHRNLANLAPVQDANFLAVLQYALEVLKVRHVVVCGHYGCGAVRTAVSGERHGLVDNWLQPVRSLFWRHAEVLDAILDVETRLNHLCERNVVEQVGGLAGNPLVHDAWRRGQPLTLHGWIYSIHDGLLRDLETTVCDLHQARALIGAPAGSDPRRKPARTRS
ncbi:carbonic anhydrase [Phenylobacterium sp.]|uniref:carbonic anhydrase n=1 Tax=Phenylobacterium sp. TaxID=1871053 RepID=UPI00286E7281|nr:carbonic anhydrase [Phenylobacterium sp.]